MESTKAKFLLNSPFNKTKRLLNRLTNTSAIFMRELLLTKATLRW